jgi:hypothetical protein
MTTLPALRQVVLLTADLAAALEQTTSFLGLATGIRDEPGMAELGFEHEVLAIDETFVEIVAPLSVDSSAGRLLARKGESGYMLVLQVADVDAVIERARGIGLAPIMAKVFEGNPLTQWHPRDLGTLAELDQMRTAEWHFCPALSDTGCTDVVADITATEIAVTDPAEYARRWAVLLGIDLAEGATTIALGGRALRFVLAESDGARGLTAVELSPTSPARSGQHATLCGVRFTVTEQESHHG